MEERFRGSGFMGLEVRRLGLQQGTFDALKVGCLTKVRLGVVAPAQTPPDNFMRMPLRMLEVVGLHLRCVGGV